MEVVSEKKEGAGAVLGVAESKKKPGTKKRLQMTPSQSEAAVLKSVAQAEDAQSALLQEEFLRDPEMKIAAKRARKPRDPATAVTEDAAREFLIHKKKAKGTKLKWSFAETLWSECLGEKLGNLTALQFVEKKMKDRGDRRGERGQVLTFRLTDADNKKLHTALCSVEAEMKTRQRHNAADAADATTIRDTLQLLLGDDTGLQSERRQRCQEWFYGHAKDLQELEATAHAAELQSLGISVGGAAADPMAAAETEVPSTTAAMAICAQVSDLEKTPIRLCEWGAANRKGLAKHVNTLLEGDAENLLLRAIATVVQAAGGMNGELFQILAPGVWDVKVFLEKAIGISLKPKTESQRDGAKEENQTPTDGGDEGSDAGEGSAGDMGANSISTSTTTLPKIDKIQTAKDLLEAAELPIFGYLMSRLVKLEKRADVEDAVRKAFFRAEDGLDGELDRDLLNFALKELAKDVGETSQFFSAVHVAAIKYGLLPSGQMIYDKMIKQLSTIPDLKVGVEIVDRITQGAQHFIEKVEPRWVSEKNEFDLRREMKNEQHSLLALEYTNAMRFARELDTKQLDLLKTAIDNADTEAVKGLKLGGARSIEIKLLAGLFSLTAQERRRIFVDPGAHELAARSFLQNHAQQHKVSADIAAGLLKNLLNTKPELTTKNPILKRVAQKNIETLGKCDYLFAAPDLHAFIKVRQDLEEFWLASSTGAELAATKEKGLQHF
eukprot:g18962.t1